MQGFNRANRKNRGEINSLVVGERGLEGRFVSTVGFKLIFDTDQWSVVVVIWGGGD